jgi:hypothetical protein
MKAMAKLNCYFKKLLTTEGSHGFGELYISLSGMSGGDGQLAIHLPVRDPRLCGRHQHQLRHFPGKSCAQSSFFQLVLVILVLTKF